MNYFQVAPAIWLCLLIAALLGFALGWLIRRLRCARLVATRDAELKAAHERVAELQARLDAVHAEVAKARSGASTQAPGLQPEASRLPPTEELTRSAAAAASDFSEASRLQAELEECRRREAEPAVGRLRTDLTLLDDLTEEVEMILTEKGNVHSQAELLARASTPEGRNVLAKETGLSTKPLLRWVNLVDLQRVEGLTASVGNLLVVAGVDTVVELGRRVPLNLTTKLAEANTERPMLEHTPSLTQVDAWVSQARDLPRIVSH